MHKKWLVWLLVPAALGAADVSGRWSGRIDFDNPGGHPDTAYLVLKQKGEQVTGTAGPGPSSQFQIEKGSIQGSKLTLEVPLPEGGRMKFNLTVEGDRIKGNVIGEKNGNPAGAAQVELTRGT